MNRTKEPDSNDLIPDVINKDKGSGYAQVPNSLIRSPEISGTAFKILCILMSNRKGWKNYKSKIDELMAEGASAQETALKQLQELDHLRKIRYRDIETKQMGGSFWVVSFTAGEMADLEEQKELLKYNGFEIWPADDYTQKSHPPENHPDGNRSDGNPQGWKSAPKNTNNKKTNNKKTNKDGQPSAKDRTKKYIPLAKYLSKIVLSHINYDINADRIKKWAKDLRLLHEQNGVNRKRQKRVMDWYKRNIGRQYVPEAFSGSAFRDKFPKLEAAIKREREDKKRNGPKTGHREPNKKYQTDGEV